MRGNSLPWPQQRLYRLIFENASDAIVVVDDDGRTLLANRAARELPGVDLPKLFLWSPARDPELTSFRAQLRVGGHAAGEVRVTDDRGQVRRLTLEGRAHGPHYAIVVRDVTARRQQEAELRHLRRLEAIGFHTASVVHDFNNLLTAITCSSALLERVLPASDAPAQLARDIGLAAARGAELTRSVLAVLRHDPAPPRRVSLADVLTQARPILERLVGPAVRVELQLRAGGDEVVVDRERLEHALLNLAANARDAMPRGGELVIATASVTLGPEGEREAPCRPGSYVVLSVTDTGVGMPPEVRERIFERFFTTKDAASGAGLGLASVHAFVVESGGCVSVLSTPDHGTTVVLYLPLAGGAAHVEETSPSDGDRDGGTETIVVVEPDDLVRRAIRRSLTVRGYRLLDAPTGDTALRQAASCPGPIALVIADASMPGMSGVEIAERLCRDGHRPKLLFVSGLTDAWLTDAPVRGQPLLRKAFSAAQLANEVRRLLDSAPPPRSATQSTTGTR